MSDADERLRSFLGTEPPPGVLALPEDDRSSLADMLHEVRARQATDLDASFDALLKQVPFPVRKIAKKVLFG